jgi:quinol monooxygenase YgiN
VVGDGRRIACDHDQKEKNMYARLISFSDADPDKREQAIQTIRETVIPTLREYDGFAGYIALFDSDNRRARAVILWESEEAAKAAEETLAERRHQMASGVGLTVESADLYEAVVVEMEGARV